MMATPVTVSTSRRDDGQLVVSVTGELDMSNIGDFDRVLAGTVAQADGTPVQVDLVGVEYLDSGAINALFAYTDQVRVLANSILMPVLKVSGITDVMSVEPGS